MKKITITLLDSDVVAIEKFRKEMIAHEKGKTGGNAAANWRVMPFEQLVEVFITVKVGEMKRGELDG